MVRDRFMDTVRVLKRKHNGELQARLVNCSASTIVVRLQGEETVFSRSTGRVLRGDQDLSLTAEELAWYSPQNKIPLGRDVAHLR